MSQVITKPAKKKKSTRKKVASKKSPMFDIVDRLRREDKLVDNTITFHFHDGTTANQTINKQFIIDERGRKRSTDHILMDINAIIHDNGASHYSIG